MMLYNKIRLDDKNSDFIYSLGQAGADIWDENNSWGTAYMPDPQATRNAALGEVVRAICIEAAYTPRTLRSLVRGKNDQLIALALAVANALAAEEAAK